MIDLKKLQKQVEELGYKSHGLYSAEGQCILVHNMAKNPSNLPQIMRMLASLPPGKYFINCSNGAGRKYAHYDFPVTIEGSTTAENQNLSEMVKTSSSGAQAPGIDAIEFGRLQAENEALKARLSEIEAAALEDEDEDEDEEPAAPTLSEKAIEAVLPIIPTLADKLLAVLDRHITPPAAQPLSEPQKLVLDAESIQQIAAHVKNMVMQDLQQMEPDNGGY